jgi:hypothetical protein
VVDGLGEKIFTRDFLGTPPTDKVNGTVSQHLSSFTINPLESLF